MNSTFQACLASLIAIVLINIPMVMASDNLRGGSRDSTSLSTRSLSSNSNASDRNIMIKTQKSDSSYFCWQTDDEYYLRGYETNCDGESSEFFYYIPKHGQIKSKKLGEEYCLTHDLDEDHYSGYLYFAKCHYGATQSWNHWDDHWSSAYNGQCIDIHRNHPGNQRYHLLNCEDTHDQRHYFYDYHESKFRSWFSY